MHAVFGILYFTLVLALGKKELHLSVIVAGLMESSCMVNGFLSAQLMLHS